MYAVAIVVNNPFTAQEPVSQGTAPLDDRVIGLVIVVQRIRCRYRQRKAFVPQAGYLKVIDPIIAVRLDPSVGEQAEHRLLVLSTVLANLVSRFAKGYQLLKSTVGLV